MKPNAQLPHVVRTRRHDWPIADHEDELSIDGQSQTNSDVNFPPIIWPIGLEWDSSEFMIMFTPASRKTREFGEHDLSSPELCVGMRHHLGLKTILLTFRLRLLSAAARHRTSGFLCAAARFFSDIEELEGKKCPRRHLQRIDSSRVRGTFFFADRGRMGSSCGFSPRVSISPDPAENAVNQGTLEMLGCVNLQSEQ
jgi:hypothetical protein